MSASLVFLGGCEKDGLPEATASGAQELTGDVYAISGGAGADLSAVAGVSTSSSPAIVVHWDDVSPSRRGDKLSATIENTTPTAIAVDIDVTGTDPCGRIVTRPLGRRVISGKGVEQVALPVASIPAQTVGLASRIRIEAHYEFGSMFPAMAGIARPKHRSATVPAHVTFDDDFVLTTIRNSDEQAKANAELLRRGPPKIGKMRRFSATKGVMEAESETILASCAVGMAVHGHQGLLRQWRAVNSTNVAAAKEVP